MTRGIRNNNPLNIRKGSAWKGLSKVQNDPSFCQFDNVLYGIRAALVLLRTYAYKHKCYSLRSVINRWCPKGDANNSPENYCYLVRKNWQTTLSCSHVFRDATDDTFCNLWYNQIGPKIFVFYLLRAMCVVESNYILNYDTYKKAVALL